MVYILKLHTRNLELKILQIPGNYPTCTYLYLNLRLLTFISTFMHHTTQVVVNDHPSSKFQGVYVQNRTCLIIYEYWKNKVKLSFGPWPCQIFLFETIIASKFISFNIPRERHRLLNGQCSRSIVSLFWQHRSGEFQSCKVRSTPMSIV